MSGPRPYRNRPSVGQLRAGMPRLLRLFGKA